MKLLLIIHAVVTFAAGIVLVAFPELIPSSVNISIRPDQYLLCYFVAAAEFGVAALSFLATKLTDKKSLQFISISFIVFHIGTALLELLAFSQGMSAKIIANIALRILISALFYYNGVAKQKT